MAGAPGWYVVQRTAPASSGHPWRWARRFALLAVGVALGLVVLVFSIVRAHWGEAPARQAVVVSMPPLATSTGTRAAPGPTLAPNAPIEDPGRPRNTLATVALQTKPDPVLPDEFALLPLESLEALERSTAGWESRPRPPAVTRLQSTLNGSPSRAQESRKEAVQPSRSSPRVVDAPANLRSAAKIQVASQATTADDGSALPAGELRVFIHHVADQRDGALAQQLAEYLRDQGFTVADIRSVDFGIAKPSVRYFFARDHAASQRLVEELGQFSAGGASLAPDRASDFAHFVPKPRPGSLEVWLPGTRGGGRR